MSEQQGPEPSPTEPGASEADPSPEERDANEAARKCQVTSRINGLRIRAAARKDSTPLDHLNEGQSLPALCSAKRGGSYTACGGTSDLWVPVTYRGRRAYVAWRCVDWYYITAAADVSAESFGVG